MQKEKNHRDHSFGVNLKNCGCPIFFQLILLIYVSGTTGEMADFVVQQP